MNPEIVERYKKVQEKFNLPHLTQLRDTFKFDIEEENEMFDRIRVEISERLFSFTERILEPIVAGSDCFASMVEQNMVTKEEREKLFTIYKKMQVLKWENNLLIVRPNEKQTLDWIKKTWNFWNSELGLELGKICKKLSVSWDTLEFKTKKAYYQG